MISTCVTMQVDRYRRQPETYNYAKMTATILIFRKRRPSGAHHGADPLFRRRILETNAAAAMPNSTPHTPPPRSTATRSEAHTSELQSLMRTSYAVICLKKKTHIT